MRTVFMSLLCLITSLASAKDIQEIETKLILTKPGLVSIELNSADLILENIEGDGLAIEDGMFVANFPSLKKRSSSPAPAWRSISGPSLQLNRCSSQSLKISTQGSLRPLSVLISAVSRFRTS